MEWRDYIHSDPEILRGMPVVKGTRLSVWFILGLFAAGWKEGEVLENYPTLTHKAIEAVFAFAEYIREESRMPSTTSGYKHVLIRGDGVPIIEGTATKVIELVEEVMAYGWSPEEIHYQHPYLSLGQIYSSLAYYWDHREELDQDIERRLQQFDEARRAAGPSPLAARLRSQGLL